MRLANGQLSYYIFHNKTVIFCNPITLTGNSYIVFKILFSHIPKETERNHCYHKILFPRKRYDVPKVKPLFAIEEYLD